MNGYIYSDATPKKSDNDAMHRSTFVFRLLSVFCFVYAFGCSNVNLVGPRAR